MAKRLQDKVGFIGGSIGRAAALLAWINRNRRPWKDAAATLVLATVFPYAAAAMILIRRIARAS